MAPFATASLGSPVPARAGIGLKARHYAEIKDSRPDLGFLEVHTENYMAAGGPSLRWLDALREDYPVSLHGVGLSLGSAGPLNADHLKRWRTAERRFEPGLVSEHLSWSVAGGDYLNDLLPLPYTEEALDTFCTHVHEMQDVLKRPVLIENPSAYMRYVHSPIPEVEFLCAVRDRTGCGILLDVNNVFVNASNFGFDALAYLKRVPAEAVAEVHLAGHHDARIGDQTLKIDDHGSRVRAEVWVLYSHLIERIGPRPTLIEWDSNVPDLAVLLDEAALADRIMAAAVQDRLREVPHALAG